MRLYQTREQVLERLVESLKESIEVIDNGKMEERDSERYALVGKVKYYLEQLAYFDPGPDSVAAK